MSYANQIRALGDRTAGMTAHEIAVAVGCSHDTAYRLLANLKVPYTRLAATCEPTYYRPTKFYDDVKRLRESNKTLSEIGEILGVSRNVINGVIQRMAREGWSYRYVKPNRKPDESTYERPQPWEDVELREQIFAGAVFEDHPRAAPPRPPARMSMPLHHSPTGSSMQSCVDMGRGG